MTARGLTLDQELATETWDEAATVFSEDELADLLFLIGPMNLYDRVNVAVQFPAAAWREHGYAGIRDVRPGPDPHARP